MDLIINLYLFLFLICASACYFALYELFKNDVTSYKWYFAVACVCFFPFMLIALDILIY